MSAVTINTKQVSIPALKKSSHLSIGFHGDFQIESTEARLPLSIGDDIIFIKVINDDMYFTNTGIINKIGKRDFVKGKPNKGGHSQQFKDRDKYHHHFKFEIKKTLKKNNMLSELEYSLPVVDNHHRPEVHFQSQYRSIPKDDFDTIVNGWVYATRTTFGKLVNSLPRQNKLEFMIQAMDHFATIDFSLTSLVDGLEFLYQYIERRILSRGRILVATDGIIKKELPDFLPVDKVGFTAIEDDAILNIHTQAQVFSDLFNLDKEINLQNSVKDMIKNNGFLESRFQDLFKRRAWPVDLEK